MKSGSPRASTSSSTSSTCRRSTTVRAFPSQLSGGERQRVGLARALAADPPAMLMDEPFGALDPITRARLQHELLRIQHEVRKTIIFVTHDIDEAILLGDRIAILREGGVLAQYDTPEALLEHPADEFVARFIGSDRGIKLLWLRRLDELELAPLDGPAVHSDGATTLRDALSLMITAGSRSLVVPDDEGEPRGVVTLDALATLDDERPARTGRACHPRFRRGERLRHREPPVLPRLGAGQLGGCDTARAVDHVKLTLIAVALGFVISFAAAVLTHRYRLPEGPF